MKRISILLICFLLFAGQRSHAQVKVDSIAFFTDEKIAELTLTTDVRKIQNEKGIDVFQPATASFRFPDSTTVTEEIRIAPRGHFRRDFCPIPPLMLNFHNPTSPLLNDLGKLKLVIACGAASDDEQLVLKEYLCYKIYNILEPKSFRVRLLRVNFRDSKNKNKPYTQYAFMIEDDAELARRNGCKTRPDQMILTENTDRQTMTMVATYEFFVSNGDWSVPNNHNTKLIWDRKNEAAPPYVVPYDFDHSGFVNAGYAAPNEILGTETVKERVYRGFPRTMEELQTTFDVYRQKKEAIYTLIRNFTLLKERNRKELIDYTEDFYKTINNKNDVQSIFIDNARKN